jgi:hypothetical protein
MATNILFDQKFVQLRLYLFPIDIHLKEQRGFVKKKNKYKLNPCFRLFVILPPKEEKIVIFGSMVTTFKPICSKNITAYNDTTLCPLFRY